MSASFLINKLALVLQEERPVLNTVCRWGAIPLATLLLILSMFQFNFYLLEYMLKAQQLSVQKDQLEKKQEKTFVEKINDL